MNCYVKNTRLALALLLLMIATLSGCSKRETYAEKDFVGKWKSSKVSTPIYLYENGEWELMSNEGEIMQYGVWQYFDNKIMWSYKIADQMGHDTNAIVSASPEEFRLRERDKSITIFSKLE